MKTLKKVTIEPVFVEESIPENDKLEEGKIYISEKYSVAVHLCLCGCKKLTVMTLKSVGGSEYWNLIKSEKGISFTPSIGNYNFPCRSHYIITNNVANFV